MRREKVDKVVHNKAFIVGIIVIITAVLGLLAALISIFRRVFMVDQVDFLEFLQVGCWFAIILLPILMVCSAVGEGWK